MAKYSLNDLESLTGIKADTIRIWESRHRILSAHRTSTNRRWYTDEDLEKLLNINLLYRQGVKISKIAAMTDLEIRERAALLADGGSSMNDEISQMLIAMNLFDERSVNDILLRSIANKGFEETFISVVFPFLSKVGLMWHTGSVDPGTEHFITAVFRKRLISAIDGIQPHSDNTGKKVMLFLPEGEWHDLILLFIAWLTLKKGHRILYLGQSTPLGSVFETAEKWKPDAIVTGAMTRIPADDPADYLLRLSKRLNGTRIFAGGTLAVPSAMPGVSFLSGAMDEGFRMFLEKP